MFFLDSSVLPIIGNFQMRKMITSKIRTFSKSKIRT